MLFHLLRLSIACYPARAHRRLTVFGVGRLGAKETSWSLFHLCWAYFELATLTWCKMAFQPFCSSASQNSNSAVVTFTPERTQQVNSSVRTWWKFRKVEIQHSKKYLILHPPFEVDRTLNSVQTCKCFRALVKAPYLFRVCYIPFKYSAVFDGLQHAIFLRWGFFIMPRN